MSKKNTDPADLIMPYGQFTFDVEGNDVEGSNYFSRKPHCPGGASGVTIGRGYDVGQRTPYEVFLHLTSAGFNPVLVKEFVKATGKTGNAAENFLNSSPVFSNPELSIINAKQQKALFEIVYPFYEADTIRWLYRYQTLTPKFLGGMICWKNLDPRIRIILVDFRFRGEFIEPRTGWEVSHAEEYYEERVERVRNNPNLSEEEKRRRIERLLNDKRKTIVSIPKLKLLKKAILDNSKLPPLPQSNETSEEATRAHAAYLEAKDRAYQTFVEYATDRETFPFAPNDRFEQRKGFLRKDYDPAYREALTYDWSFTSNAEEATRDDLSKAYVPVNMENRSGAVMGKGFNLRTRHYYKSSILGQRTSIAFPEEKARNEIVRTGFEIREIFKAIGITDENKVLKILEGRTKYGPNAESFKSQIPDLSPGEIEHLFNLTICCYESDVILTCINRLVYEKANGVRKRRGQKEVTIDQILNNEVRVDHKCMNWARLNPKIKAILVDLSFTGDLHYMSRKFLIPPISANNLQAFTNAVGDPNNWKFSWNRSSSSRVAIPPTLQMLQSRFELRRRFLSNELIAPIEQDSSQQRLDFNVQTSNRHLTKLVPCALCKPESQSSTNLTAAPNIPDIIGATPRIIPELIQLEWTCTKSWSSGNDIEPEPSEPVDDPFDNGEPIDLPIEEPDSPTREEDLIPDLFSPIEGVECSIEPKEAGSELTDEILLHFGSADQLSQVGRNYLMRYQSDDQEYHYVYIITDIETQADESTASVRVSEEIDFTKLHTTNVHFDHFYDFEGPHFEFGGLTQEDFDLDDIFFPLPNIRKKMLPAEGQGRITKRVQCTNQDNLDSVAEGYRIRARLKEDTTTENDENENEKFLYRKITKIHHPSVETAPFEFELEKDIDFDKITDDQVYFDVPFLLPLNKMGLCSLLGDALPSIDTVISTFSKIKKYIKVRKNEEGELVGITIPINLTLYIPKDDKKRQPLSLYCNLRFEKKESGWGLEKDGLGRFYLALPLMPSQIIDFGIFSLVLPKKATDPEVIDQLPNPSHPENPRPDISKSDVYFDLTKREIGFTFNTLKGKEIKNLELYFPGGLSDELGEEALKAEKDKRFLFELEKFNPNMPREPEEKDEIFLRINSEGLSVKAKVTDKEVIASDSATNGLLKSIKFKPVKKSGNIESSILIINNDIKEASVFAQMQLPGFKSLEAKVSATLKQQKPGVMPTVQASLELENGDKSSLAELDLKMLQMKMDSIRLELKWSNQKWDFNAYVDGKVSLTSIANILEDLKDLKDAAAIQLKNLNLKSLNLPKIDLGLNLEKPSRFNILDGLFTCSFDDLNLDWEFDANQLTKGGFLKCINTSFTFNLPGSLTVDIESANLDIQFDGSRFSIDLPNTIGIRAKLGESVDFKGVVGWVENEKERYFFAQGNVAIEGLDIAAALKLGTLQKENGEKATNFILYAETDFEVELFAGVVLKKIGAGVGINNKLELFSDRPNESEIIQKINKIAPAELKNWQAVEENGMYISIIASAMIASNRGSPSSFNAYIMHLIMSIDSNFDFMAAGKLWLASSMKYLKEKDHMDRPALIGALVLSTRDKRLGIELQSKKNPAIESSELLSTILDKMTTKLTFKITPDLVDYYLEEISYKDKLLGANVEISGSYRFAIYRSTFLAKAGIHILGHYHKSFRSSIGGFSCTGSLYFDAEYGGLFSAKGINLYGLIKAGLSFEASAFIDIVFRISFKIFGKRISWSYTIRFSISLPTVNVRFRGALAITDRGTIGFEGLVGIGISICGYRLEMEPRISYKPHIVTKVKNKVIAFEKLLDKALENSESKLNEKFLNFYNTHESLEAKTFKISHKEITEKNENVQSKWLHYRSVQAINKAALNSSEENNNPQPTHKIIKESFIPAQKTKWLTPYYQTQESPDEEIVFEEDVSKIAVGKISPDFTATQFEVLEQDPNNLPTLVKIHVEETLSNHIEVNASIVLETAAENLAGIWTVTQTENQTIIVSINPPDLTGSPETSRGESPTEILRTISEVGKFFVPGKILYAPWDKDIRLKFEAENNENSNILRAFFLETSIERENELIEPLSDIQVIYDPRVESASREFTVLEAQSLPEDVWSARFNEFPREVNLENTSRQELAMIAKYELIQKLKSSDRAHKAGDYSLQEQQSQSKAKLINSLLKDLNSQGPERFKEEVKRKVSRTEHILGLICQKEIPIGASLPPIEEDIYIVRSNRYFEKSNLINPGEGLESLKEQITPLKVRQDYFPSEKDPSSGKVKISLPIKFEPEFFERDELEQIGHFEVYRNGTKTPVGSYLQPNIWTFRHKQVLQTGEFSTSSEEANFSFLKLDFSLIEAMSKHYHFALLVESKKTKHKELIQLGLNNNEFQGSVSHLSGEYYFSLQAYHQNTQIVVEPFVFVDEINVTKQKAALLENYIDYTLKILPTAAQQPDPQSDQQSEPPSIDWGREMLYIPPKKEVLEDISIALPVTALVKDSNFSEKGTFLLLKGENREKLNFSADEFEIWVEEIPMQKTGFYAGNLEENVQGQKKNNKPSFKSLNHEKRLESTDGKQKLDIEIKSNEESLYSITNINLFRFDCSYKFFFLKKNQNQKKLTPMQHLLLKGLPKDFEEIKAKSAAQIEWIRNNAYQEIISRSKELNSPELFYVKDKYEILGGNFIDVTFEQSDINEGGVELLFVDQDEPGYVHRQLCEVLAEQHFYSNHKDFRIASDWRVPSWVLRFSNKLIRDKDATIWGQIPSSDDLYVSLDSDLIKNLREAALHLVEMLKGSYSWPDLYSKARTFLVYLAQFENSPLNIHFPQQLKTIEAIKNSFSNILLGSSKTESLDSIFDKLHKVKEKLEQDTDNISIDKHKERAFYLDVDFSNRLLGVIQRRIAIVRDLFNWTQLNELPAPEGFDEINPINQKLPGLGRWNTIVSEHTATINQLKEENPNFPRDKHYLLDEFAEFKVLTALFSVENVEKTNKNELKTQITTLLEQFSSNSDDSYKSALGRIVPVASAATLVLDKVSSAHSLYKRMHHSIIRDDSDPQKVIGPQNTDFKQFLPDSLKVAANEETKMNIQNLYLSSSQLFSSFFNLIEYLGFAVDVALADSLGKELIQEKIVLEINDAIKNLSEDSNTRPLIEKHNFFILRGIAPNTSGFQKEYDSYSFAKLVSIPKNIFLRNEIATPTLKAIKKNQIILEEGNISLDNSLCACCQLTHDGKVESHLIAKVEKENNNTILTLEVDQLEITNVPSTQVAIYEYMVDPKNDIASTASEPNKEKITLKEIKEKQIILKNEGLDINSSLPIYCQITHNEKVDSHLITKIDKDNENITLTLEVDQLEITDVQSTQVTIYEYNAGSIIELLAYRNVNLNLSESNSEIPILYKKYLSLMALKLDQLAPPSDATTINVAEILIERSNTRWQTLPSKAHYSKTTWKVPDRFGHRYRVGARNVSRYEPLINWHINRYTLFDLPEYSEFEAKSKLVRVKPIEYGVERENKEQMLLTYQYSHPTKALFSYQLSVDAARAIKNQIAAIRTGYKGCDLVFYHELLNSYQKPILGVLNKMLEESSVRNNHDCTNDPNHTCNYDSGIERKIIEPKIRLFDHERLLSMAHLPYYYKYFFNIRTLYNSHFLPQSKEGAANKLVTSATVQPSRLYTFKPTVSKRIEGEYLYYDFALPLTRNMDNLTPTELVKEPHSLNLSQNNHVFQARDLPDLNSVYNIFWELKAEGKQQYHLPVISLHMPWSEEHNPKDEDHLLFPRLKNTNDKFHIAAISSTSPRFVEGNIKEEVPSEHSKEYMARIEFKPIPKESGEEYSIEESHFNSVIAEVDHSDYNLPNVFYAYRVCFTLKILIRDSEELDMYNDPNNFVLQISRERMKANKMIFQNVTPAKQQEEKVTL